MSRKKFRQIYGKDVEEKIVSTKIAATKEEIALAVQPNDRDDPFSWADDEAITIIHYYVRKYDKDMLYKLSNGEILNQEEMDELIESSREKNKQNQMMQMQQAMMGQ